MCRIYRYETLDKSAVFQRRANFELLSNPLQIRIRFLSFPLPTEEFCFPYGQLTKSYFLRPHWAYPVVSIKLLTSWGG